MPDGAQGVHLVFISGPEDGRELRRKLPVVLGRLPENEVSLQYDYLASRRHARLSHDGTAFVLEDLGSRNGTFLLTGEPLHSPARIEPGAIFRVGGIWIKLVGECRV